MLAEVKRWPVTVLSGFLGAGKTMLLNNHDGRRLGDADGNVMGNGLAETLARSSAGCRVSHAALAGNVRRKELVFIESGMDRAAIIEAVVGEESRFDPSSWTELPDPFPLRRRAPEAA